MADAKDCQLETNYSSRLSFFVQISRNRQMVEWVTPKPVAMKVAIEVAMEVVMEVVTEVAKVIAIVAVMSMKTVLMMRLGSLVFVLADHHSLEIIFVFFLVFLLLPNQPKIIFDEIFCHLSTRWLLLYSELDHM